MPSVNGYVAFFDVSVSPSNYDGMEEKEEAVDVDDNDNDDDDKEEGEEKYDDDEK